MSSVPVVLMNKLPRFREVAVQTVKLKHKKVAQSNSCISPSASDSSLLTSRLIEEKVKFSPDRDEFPPPSSVGRKRIHHHDDNKKPFQRIPSHGELSSPRQLFDEQNLLGDHCSSYYSNHQQKQQQHEQCLKEAKILSNQETSNPYKLFKRFLNNKRDYCEDSEETEITADTTAVFACLPTSLENTHKLKPTNL
ncbi:unnamed protein product [Trichobilharzia regenti]|nr:unnamed protein product [Trichobilharzia regenti]